MLPPSTFPILEEHLPHCSSCTGCWDNHDTGCFCRYGQEPGKCEGPRESKPTEAIVDFIGSMMSTILNKSKEGFPLTMKMVDEALEVLPEQAPCCGGFKYSKAQK